MNIYEILYLEYESYESILLSHPTKSEEEFDADVLFALRNHGKEYIEQEDVWCGTAPWIEFVVEKLIENGYQRYYHEHHEIKFVGPGIIRSRHDDEFAETEWKKVVGEELYSLAALKNENHEETMP